MQDLRLIAGYVARKYALIGFPHIMIVREDVRTNELHALAHKVQCSGRVLDITRPRF